jgi:hypothetical protein
VSPEPVEEMIMAESFAVLDGEFLDGAVAEIWRDGDVIMAEVRIPGKAEAAEP